MFNCCFGSSTISASVKAQKLNLKKECNEYAETSWGHAQMFLVALQYLKKKKGMLTHSERHNVKVNIFFHTDKHTYFNLNEI